MTLAARGLSVQFGGLHALSDVSIVVEPGQVTGVVGPNGAGKTTLFNCLTGFVKPDAGQVLMGEEDISSLAPHARARAGLARTFQTPRVDLEATVFASVALGCYVKYRPSMLSSLFWLPQARRTEAEIRQRTETALGRVGLLEHRGRHADELSLAHLRTLEVARATVADPRYLLLDEPAAGLGGEDRNRLAAIIKDLCSRGIGVVIIEHNLEFLSSISDVVCVMHRGTVLFTGSPQEFRNSTAVREAYVGKGRATERKVLS